jgi:hypothetical protein
MKINEKRMRELVREALTLRKSFDHDKLVHQRARDEEIKYAIEQGWPEEEVENIRRRYDIEGTPAPVGKPPPGGKGTATGQGDFDKRRFDKSSEVARRGYVVRSVRQGIVTALMTWSRTREVPCMIHRDPPIGRGPVSLLLRGGHITFADSKDVVSRHEYTPSGPRLYPTDTSTLWNADRENEEGKINISWDDIAKEAGDDPGMWHERTTPYIVGEAFIVGSYPEAVVIRPFKMQPGPRRDEYVEQTMRELEKVDLPIIDGYLRPCTLERARQVLESTSEEEWRQG